jgi:hypothetical protein
VSIEAGEVQITIGKELNGSACPSTKKSIADIQQSNVNGEKALIVE